MSEWFPSLIDYCSLIHWETRLPKILPRLSEALLFEILLVRMTHPVRAWRISITMTQRSSFIYHSHVELQERGLWDQHSTSKHCGFQGNGTLDRSESDPFTQPCIKPVPLLLHLNFIYIPPSPRIHSNSVFSFIWEMACGSSCFL